MFGEGYTNTTFRVTLSDGTPVVVRIYRDARSGQREIAALDLVRGVVPVPAVLHRGARFAVLEYVDAITYRQFRHTAGAEAIARASRAIGRALAALARVRVDERDDDDLVARFDAALASPLLAQRLGAELLRAAQRFVARGADRLAALRGARAFVHGDFNNRNVLIAVDGTVAAIVDWENARAGSPLLDVARFLQYETRERPVREPHFSEGYREGGGVLPDGWWEATRIINVVHQCELLGEAKVPEDVVAEVRELVRGAALPPRPLKRV
jgi:aminoglycoside phosphotransferase (APT) family kinase protein